MTIYTRHITNKIIEYTVLKSLPKIAFSRHSFYISLTKQLEYIRRG